MLLQKKYDKCKVIIFELTNESLSNARTTKRHPIATYYRLLLAKLIPKVNKMIYLDGDTLIFTDLTEMINLEMNNNIILGFVDDAYKKAEQFGIKTYKYITCGVLLINLEKMRKENISQKFFDFINNKKRLAQKDQTIINIVLDGRIDLLPPKFGMWDFVNKEKVLNHNYYGNKQLGIQAYSNHEILKGWRQPSILHFTINKPWKRKSLFKTQSFFQKKWWEYAKKSDEFKNILKFTKGKKI